MLSSGKLVGLCDITELKNLRNSVWQFSRYERERREVFDLMGRVAKII
jgi:hypothetical protein